MLSQKQLNDLLNYADQLEKAGYLDPSPIEKARIFEKNSYISIPIFAVWLLLFFISTLPSFFIRRFVSSKSLQQGHAIVIAIIILFAEMAMVQGLKLGFVFYFALICAAVCNYFILRKENKN